MIKLKSENPTLGFLVANDTRSGIADSTGDTVGWNSVNLVSDNLSFSGGKSERTNTRSKVSNLPCDFLTLSLSVLLPALTLQVI